MWAFLSHIQVIIDDLCYILKACEEAIAKCKTVNISSAQLNLPYVQTITAPILYPVIQGCETKDPKLTKVLCLEITTLIFSKL